MSSQAADFAARRVMMVDTQVRPSDVTKFPIIEAMLAVPREEFVPAIRREAAYVGENIPLGEGRVMIEARTLAKMLDALDIQPTDHVLVVGCGMGYSTAVIARMAADVTGVEQVVSLADAARSTLSDRIVTGNLVDGAPRKAPFDVILIEGGVEDISDALCSQLREGGRMAAIFMEGALGVAKVGTRIEGRINWRFAFNATAPVLPGFAKMRAFAL